MHRAAFALLLTSLGPASWPQGADSRLASRPAAPRNGEFPARWIDGSNANEPPVQVHAYNDDLYILRQSVKTDSEAPFLYLLFGAHRALLHDSGAGKIDIAGTVRPLVDAWARKHNKKELPLLVTHSHAHGDHVAGDSELSTLPNCTVVGTSAADVQKFFAIQDWPREAAVLDLGDRVLDVLPIPGHEKASIALYDRQTGILLTGDTLYPGRLYIEDMGEYLSSLERLDAFIRKNPVRWFLGAHIEMSTTPKKDIKSRAKVHENEHPLQLTKAVFDELLKECRAMKDKPERKYLDEFVLYPVPRR